MKSLLRSYKKPKILITKIQLDVLYSGTPLEEFGISDNLLANIDCGVCGGCGSFNCYCPGSTCDCNPMMC